MPTQWEQLQKLLKGHCSESGFSYSGFERDNASSLTLEKGDL